MYVILTSKSGRFRTGLTPGLTPVETCDYLFHESRKARFVIAASTGPPRIRVVAKGEGGAVNGVPCKLLHHLEIVEPARCERRSLPGAGSVQERQEPVSA